MSQQPAADPTPQAPGEQTPGFPVTGDQDPFDPDGITWTRVSPKLATQGLLMSGIFCGVVLLVLLVLALALTPWLWLAAPIPVLLMGWLSWLIPRRVRAWGYTERGDDLIIRHGVLFKTLVVVPYGRMQYVDVQAGPLDRAFGLATVQLHTASPGTDAAIPGLVASEASRLRDRLASRGEAQLAGL